MRSELYQAAVYQIREGIDYVESNLTKISDEEYKTRIRNRIRRTVYIFGRLT